MKKLTIKKNEIKIEITKNEIKIENGGIIRIENEEFYYENQNLESELLIEIYPINENFPKKDQTCSISDNEMCIDIYFDKGKLMVSDANYNFEQEIDEEDEEGTVRFGVSEEGYDEYEWEE